MKAFFLSAVLATAVTASTTAGAETRSTTTNSETNALRQAEGAVRAARAELVAARTRWDAAVANDHPNPAGAWARRHFAAMQQVKAAERRWQAAKDQSETGGAIASRTR
ncbi:hypothetical protein BH11MYX3_BH11MYX3_43330 [soil metagenome]